MFNHQYFSPQYFPPIWFAPGDDSHLLPEEKKPDVEWLGGGADVIKVRSEAKDYSFLNPRDDHDQVKEDRVKLGIIPEEVKKAIKEVAEVKVKSHLTDAHSEVSELKAYLDKEKIAWYNFYEDLLKDAVNQIINDEIAARMRLVVERQNEEQEIMMLLFSL